MKLSFLHTNDTHGYLTRAKLPFLLKLRLDVDLYFDSGDCIKTGNLGVPLKPDPVWGLLADARCDASVIGNRETHVTTSAFAAKIRGAKHSVLCANLATKAGKDPLPRFVILEKQGFVIGVLGVSVPIVTARMASAPLSAYLWSKPIDKAVELAKELRSKCGLVIALTHIGVAQDRLLAETCPEIDIILGGHSHTVLRHPEMIGRTYICQGGSHAKYIGRYEWESGRLSGSLVEWPNSD